MLVEVGEGDDWRRYIVLREAITDNQVTQEQLDLAVPYGEPWEDKIKVTVTPRAIARAMRQAGLWTNDDLLANPLALREAFSRVFGSDMAALLRSANLEVKNAS